MNFKKLLVLGPTVFKAQNIRFGSTHLLVLAQLLNDYLNGKGDGYDAVMVARACLLTERYTREVLNDLVLWDLVKQSPKTERGDRMFWIDHEGIQKTFNTYFGPEVEQ